MSDSPTTRRWAGEELALHRALTALADHGTTIAGPVPLPAPRVVPARRQAGLRSGVRLAAVGLLAAAAMAVPVAISGFVPGLPFSGDPVTAVGPPATQGPLCDTLSDVAAPAGDRVLRPSATGPLALAPTEQEPRLAADEIRRRLQAAGTTFQPGTQLRYGTVDGTPAWTVTTCGPAADGTTAAVLTVADEQGRVTAHASAPINAARAGRYEAVPRSPDGASATAQSLAALTPDAQVVAAGADGLRTVMYRAQLGQLCAIAVAGSPAQTTPSGVCASTLRQDDGEFAVGSSWTGADTSVRVTGFAPVGTSWLSVQQDGQPARDVLLRTTDAAHGDRAGFTVPLDRSAQTVLVGYDAAGEETGRIVQEFEDRDRP